MVKSKEQLCLFIFTCKQRRFKNGLLGPSHHGLPLPSLDQLVLLPQFNDLATLQYYIFLPATHSVKLISFEQQQLDHFRLG